jgi:hypothetical protein
MRLQLGDAAGAARCVRRQPGARPRGVGQEGRPALIQALTAFCRWHGIGYQPPAPARSHHFGPEQHHYSQSESHCRRRKRRPRRRRVLIPSGIRDPSSYAASRRARATSPSYAPNCAAALCSLPGLVFPSRSGSFLPSASALIDRARGKANRTARERDRPSIRGSTAVGQWVMEPGRTPARSLGWTHGIGLAPSAFADWSM